MSSRVLLLLAFRLVIVLQFLLPAVVSGVEQDDFAQVLATVNGQSITHGEVEALVKMRLGNRPHSDLHAKKAREYALEHLIDRRVIYDFLIEKGYAPGKNRLQLEIDRSEEELKSAGQSLNEVLRERRMTMDHFRFEAAWRLGWQAYLEQRLTDDVLERFFNERRRRFDGTELRVAQLFQKTTPDHLEQTKRALAQIRTEVLAGDRNWDDAVSQHSVAPSKERQGEVGWIGFDGPMSPEFTRAAFELKAGEISKPVTSSFGVHLIRCLDVRVGTLGFRDAYQSVRDAAMKERFRLLADHQRPQVTVKRISANK